MYFYPRPPRGGRPRRYDFIDGFTIISTHALREEGDAHTQTRKPKKPYISTHALREEGDTIWPILYCGVSAFLPTPSARRATRRAPAGAFLVRVFLPTPSARRATLKILHGTSA